MNTLDTLVKVIVKAAQGGHFPGKAFFCIYNDFIVRVVQL